MPDKGYVNLGLDVLDWNRGLLTVEGDHAVRVPGEPALTPELVGSLRKGSLDPKIYGGLLFNALMPPEDKMRREYRKILAQARRTGAKVRLRLMLSLNLSEQVHRLCWERLYDPDTGSAIARDPMTAFSRYAPGGLGVEPVSQVPRLLIAVAAPSDVQQHEMAVIHRGAMQERLEELLVPLRGAMEWEFLEPPLTAVRLRDRLRGSERPFHALHLVAHGYIDSRAGAGVLVLEQDNGTCDFFKEDELPQVFLGIPDLRLLTLMTCHGAVLSHEHPLSGLGRQLVRHEGLPAVISMQDGVSFATAEEFFAAFYRNLCDGGRVDIAVNETRHHLYLKDRAATRWSDPLLFTRLTDGALFRPKTKARRRRAAAKKKGSKEPQVPLGIGETSWPAVDLPRTGLFAGLGRIGSLPPLPSSFESARAMAGLLATDDDAQPNFGAKIVARTGRRVFDQLKRNLRRFFQQEKTHLLVFLSGYGEIEEHGGFVLVDAIDGAHRILYLDEILELARKSPATCISLVFDCCRPPLADNPAQPERPEIRLREGVSLLASNRDPDPEAQGEVSLFTELLLYGLGGAAADVQGRVWASALYALAEPILLDWGHRPIFRSSGGSRDPLRRCSRRVPTDQLSNLEELFSAPGDAYQLTPSHEYTHRTSVPTDVRVFNQLRVLRNAGLVEVEDDGKDEGKDLYFAALESRRVRLTRLGQLYWRQAKEGRLSPEL